MISPLLVAAYGVIFGVACAVSLYFLDYVLHDPSKGTTRSLSLALVCISAAAGCGLLIGGRSLSVFTLVGALVAVVVMSVGCYASFMKIRVPFWFGPVMAVSTIVAGLQTGSISTISDGVIVGLPFGITAVYLRKSRAMLSEACTCFALGSYFGMGLGLLSVAAGTFVAVTFFRKPGRSVLDFPILGCMYGSGVAVLAFSSIFFG